MKTLLKLFAFGIVLIIIACKSNPVNSNPNNNIPIQDTLVDADGNKYLTVKIGNQEWMAEDLHTTKYNDGTPITNVTADSDWGCHGIPAFCYYNNKSNKNIIYNWYAVSSGKLAPTGWHVSTDDDWQQLENYLIHHGYNWNGDSAGSGDINEIAKSMAAQGGWQTTSDMVGAIGNDLSKNNKSGFSALPAGYRDNVGRFEPENIGVYVANRYNNWWTTKDDGGGAGSYVLDYDLINLARRSISKAVGFSVRLVHDSQPVLKNQ